MIRFPLSSILFVLIAATGIQAQAAVPAEIQSAYSQLAQETSPGFVANAVRGQTFFRQRFGLSAQMPSCEACHTENPKLTGRHAVTGKLIQPLAPAANAARLTDAAHVEKWFRRNCKEVVGRACTAAEKADVVAYLASVR